MTLIYFSDLLKITDYFKYHVDIQQRDFRNLFKCRGQTAKTIGAHASSYGSHGGTFYLFVSSYSYLLGVFIAVC